MINNLFSSKVLFDILTFLFKNDSRAFSTSEIVKDTKRKQVNVLRELEKLTKWGMVKKEKKDNQNYYKLNNDFTQHKELAALFASVKNDLPSKYVLLVEEGGAALFALNYFYRGFSSDVPVKLGILTKQLSVLAHHKGDYMWVYFKQNDFEYGAKESLKKLLDNPSFVDELIHSESKVHGEQALNIYNDLLKNNFKATPDEAVQWINKFSEIIINQIGLNTVAIFDLRDYVFSNYLKKYLDKKTIGSELTTNIVMEKLLEPPELTFTQQLRLEVVNLAFQIKTQAIDRQPVLETIQKKWQWLNFGYRGPILGVSFFENMLLPLLNLSVSELEKEIKLLNDRPRFVAEEKKKIFEHLKIDGQHQKFIKALSLLSYLKVYRKDISFLLVFLTYEFIKQYNNTLKIEEVHFLTLEEVKDLILDRLAVSKAELKLRMSECVTFGKDDNVIYTGQKVNEIIEQHVAKDEFPSNSDKHQIKLIEGTTACLGRTGDWVYGKVKIVNSTADMAKMNAGDILVSVATVPEIVPAMKKAGAIVTDHGGITSHAAIVSRELNVPCLIGTKYATKLFKDGDEVIVCPRHGYIKFQ